MVRAKAEAEARAVRAKGEADAITTVFRAIHEGHPDTELLAYQYLQVLPQIAQGDSNKIWIVPSELGQGARGTRRVLPGGYRVTRPGQREQPVPVLRRHDGHVLRRCGGVAHAGPELQVSSAA